MEIKEEVTLESIAAKLIELQEFTQRLADDFDTAQNLARGPAGTRGEAGKDGKDSTVAGPVGPAGKDAHIRIGKVTAGEKAHAVIQNGVLDLTLPRGERGADSQVPGPAGPKGDSIIGPKGDKGESIVGPRGERGADSQIAGPKGDPGKDAVSPKFVVGDVHNGEEAAVRLEKVGDDYRISFILPRGEKGETGVGEQGVQGPEPDMQELLTQVESRLRRVWKSDIGIALRQTEQRLATLEKENAEEE
jgi:hypothetical protein